MFARSIFFRWATSLNINAPVGFKAGWDADKAHTTGNNKRHSKKKGGWELLTSVQATSDALLRIYKQEWNSLKAAALYTHPVLAI